MANNEFTVNGIDVRFKKINKDDYISLTDLARYANLSEPKVAIATWMRSKDVISYLELWERLHNPISKGANSRPLRVRLIGTVFIFHRKNGLKALMQSALFRSPVTTAERMSIEILRLSSQVG